VSAQQDRLRFNLLSILLVALGGLGLSFGAYFTYARDALGSMNFLFAAACFTSVLVLWRRPHWHAYLSTFTLINVSCMAVYGYLAISVYSVRICLLMTLLPIIILVAIVFVALWSHEKLSDHQARALLRLESYEANEQRLRLALNAAQMGVWEFDLRRNKLYWSPEIFRFFGLPQFEPSVEKLMSLLDSRDAVSLQEAVDTAVANRASFHTEFRLGVGTSQRWVEDYGEVECDPDGTPARIVGVARDVTERRLAQEELVRFQRIRDDQRVLFQTILDNAPFGIWMLGLDGRLSFVNRAFCVAVGVTESQFVAAAHYADVLPSNVASNCKRSDQECFAQRDLHRSTEKIPFVDGREHVLEITKVCVVDAGGKIQGLIGLAVDVTEQRDYASKLEHIAHFDPLTGAPNRALLADRMMIALAQARRERAPLAVCYLDLDGFKIVNDTWGHSVGDRVLVEVARRLQNEIREGDTLARMGGDEFVVLLTGLESTEVCSIVIERLLNAVRLPILIDATSLQVSVSVGVALYPNDDCEADMLLRHADQAMYAAKQSGRNRFHMFDAEGDRFARAREETIAEIRHGLALGQLVLYYQPKIDLRTQDAIGVEALIRWLHPSRGLLLPSEFLPTIANSELEIDVGDWVLATSLRQLKTWSVTERSFAMCINASAHQLLSAGFVDRLRRLLVETDLDSRRHHIEIEITETAIMTDVARIGQIIRECRVLGVRFALDDFGTGYSSLTHLRSLDIDAVKIDSSFVRGMSEEPHDRAIIQGVVAMTKAFGRVSVAEGIETESQFQALLGMGCDVGQGFFWAPPMPAEMFDQWR